MIEDFVECPVCDQMVYYTEWDEHYKDHEEKINPGNCKWFQVYNGVLGCFLHPLSDGTPSHCTNSIKYPCERLKEEEGEKI